MPWKEYFCGHVVPLGVPGKSLRRGMLCLCLLYVVCVEGCKVRWGLDWTQRKPSAEAWITFPNVIALCLDASDKCHKSHASSKSSDCHCLH